MKQELNSLEHLITSDGWKIFLNILLEHKDYLQNEVNKFVRANNLIEAFAALAKYDDIDKQLQLLNKKITDLKQEE